MLMSLLTSIKRTLLKFIRNKKETEPGAAYDLWASTYDEQTNNPIVYLNEIVFNEILGSTNIEGKIIVDIGCGTGALWKNILTKNPKELIGYEVSTGMIHELQKKFPSAKAYISNDNSLKELANSSCDIIISTLVVGYFKDLSGTFLEWNRVLKKNGEIIIIDFHPVALQSGANRCLKHKGQTIFIKNHIHSLDKIKTLANKTNWKAIRSVEEKVDEKIKHFYKKQGSLEVYEKTYNTPILYGLHFIKTQ